MPTLTKGDRTVVVADNDRQLLAYYLGDGWSVQGEEPTVTPPAPAPVVGSLDLGDQDDDPADDVDEHPNEKTS